MLIIVGCDDNKTTVEGEPTGMLPNLVDDSELLTYDEIIGTHDNKVVLTGGAADPFMIRFNGMYYLYMTTGGRKIRGYKSLDMYTWQEVENAECEKGFVYDYALDENAPNHSHSTPYAPEVYYFNGKFYLITSPSGQGHFVLSSDSPEGPFKAISGNIGKSIDGHYFVDGKDEKIYLYTAGANGMTCYEMEDDMYTVKTDEKGKEKMMIYFNTMVGNWNEGPFMLQKNGNYFLTYCGTHYLSAAYRVDYAYADKNADLLDGFAFNREDSLLLSTKDNFKGLGHSSTILGPDLDSYYLIYHNLDNNGRNLNYSRLSFNGSMMVANDVKDTNVIKASLPEFSTNGNSNLVADGEFLLSDKASSDTFTVEFNVKGEGKMLFAYQDSNNYAYIEYQNNNISLFDVKNGTANKIKSIDLIRDYNTNVLHTFRLQYRNGITSLYFDGIEKLYNFEYEFKGGKIGYLKNNNFIELGYSAFSNVALGSSDNLAYNDHLSLANAIDYHLSYLTGDSKFVSTSDNSGQYVSSDSYNLLVADEGNRATFRSNLDDGKYSINLRIPAKYRGEKVGVRIDASDIREVTIPNDIPSSDEDGDILVSLGVYDIVKGQHHVSLYNVGDAFEFSSLIYEKVAENGLNLIFDSSFDDEGYFVKNNANITDNGYKVEKSNVYGLINTNIFFNSSISSDILIDDIAYGGYVGVAFNVSAYANYPVDDADGAKYAYPFKGYLLSVDRYGISLNVVNFKSVESVMKYDFDFTNNQQINLKIEQVNNKFIVYLDNDVIFTYVANVGNLSGSAGIFAKNADATFKNLIIE